MSTTDATFKVGDEMTWDDGRIVYDGEIADVRVVEGELYGVDLRITGARISERGVGKDFWLGAKTPSFETLARRSAPPRSYVDVVFDGPPAHESGRFVECENVQGASINAGEWIDRGDGLWALRIYTER